LASKSIKEVTNLKLEGTRGLKELQLGGDRWRGKKDETTSPLFMGEFLSLGVWDSRMRENREGEKKNEKKEEVSATCENSGKRKLKTNALLQEMKPR